MKTNLDLILTYRNGRAAGSLLCKKMGFYTINGTQYSIMIDKKVMFPFVRATFPHLTEDMRVLFKPGEK